MLNYTVLRTEQDKANWANERKSHNPDFDPDLRIPCIVFYCDTESNGYPDTFYYNLNVNDVGHLLSLLKG